MQLCEVLGHDPTQPLHLDQVLRAQLGQLRVDGLAAALLLVELLRKGQLRLLDAARDVPVHLVDLLLGVGHRRHLHAHVFALLQLLQQLGRVRLGGARAGRLAVGALGAGAAGARRVGLLRCAACHDNARLHLGLLLVDKARLSRFVDRLVGHEFDSEHAQKANHSRPVNRFVGNRRNVVAANVAVNGRQNLPLNQLPVLHALFRV